MNRKKIAEEKEYLLSHMTEENPKTRELIGYSLPGSLYYVSAGNGYILRSCLC